MTRFDARTVIGLACWVVFTGSGLGASAGWWSWNVAAFVAACALLAQLLLKARARAS